MIVNILKYYLFVGTFSLSLYGFHEEASYYCIQQNSEGKDIIFIYTKDGGLLDSYTINKGQKPTGILKTGPKPQPIKAVINCDNQLGRFLGFMDKHNNLVGSWRSFDDSQYLHAGEVGTFADIDISCLQDIEENS